MGNTVLKNAGTESGIMDINDCANVDYWSDYFNVHNDKLIEAAAIVGPSIQALHKYFQKQFPEPQINYK